MRAPNVARWDGSSWMAVGCGLSNSGPGAIVCSLAVYDEGAGPRLFAGALDSHDRSVARWDGRSWSQVGTGLWHIGGMTGPWPSVCDLVVHDDGSGAGPRLYAGGRFFCSWATGAPNVAAWDGVEWVALSQGIGGSYDRVDALAEYDDGAGSGPVLFAGGDFRPASGVPVWYLARWDGAEWSGCGFPTEGILGTVISLAVYDAGSGSDLFAAGWFPAAGGVLHASIASWDGNAWHPLPGGGLGGTGPAHGSVAALEVFDPPGPARPVLVAAGTFQQIGGTALPGIGSWDGSAWSGLSTGLDHWVHDLTTADFGAGASLFACGYFGHAGNVKADHLARWDGSRWWGVGGGPGFVPLALLGCAESPDGGPALYVGGGYGPITSCIRRWDGTSWSPLGSGLDGPVLALAQYQGDVYAGGFFTHSGVQRVGHLARWDGSTWSDVSGGTDGDVAALGVWDDGSGSGPSLYVGGDFHHAGTLEAEGLARWDGSAWSSAGDVAPLQNGTYPSIMSFATHDDGNGPALFMGGAFRRVGDVPSSAIARLSNTCGVSPVAYCPAKLNSRPVPARDRVSGTPSATRIRALPGDGDRSRQQQGRDAVLRSAAPAANPYQGGTLCVLGPVKRTPVQGSGGNPPPDDCSGSYSFDFNALIQSGATRPWCRARGLLLSTGTAIRRARARPA